MAITMMHIALNATLNSTRPYSPVVMNQEWSALWRMILLTSLCIEGTILNGYFVSSFFVENALRKAGLVYLAFTGLADMMITSVVTPGATVMLIAKMDSLFVCYVFQILVQGAVYLYSLSFAMVAVETYVRLCQATTCYITFLKLPTGLVSILFVLISFTVSFIGVWFQMDYDYCTRESYGNYTFRLITTLVFQAIPFTVSILFLVSASLVMRARARRLVNYKRSKQYDWDYASTNLHIGCYLLYVVAWLPYLIIVNKYPYTTDDKYYNCIWLGLFRSFITSIVYSCLNRDFRLAFARLFVYCFCKSSMTVPYRHHRAGLECHYRAGDLKVHIMHGMLPNTPQRSVATCAGEAFCFDRL